MPQRRRLRSEMTEAEVAHERRADLWRKYQREMGKPRTVLPHEQDELVAKVKAMHDEAGMTEQQIADATGGRVSMRTVNDIFRDGKTACYRETYDAIMSAEFVSPAKNGARLSPLGTARRLQALRANGWPLKSGVLTEMSGIKPPMLQRLCSGKQKQVFFCTHRAVKEMYEKLQYADPSDYGVSEESIRKAKTWGEKAGYAPSTCWDEDTIEDPAAKPEWTGACGSWAGYRIHIRETFFLGNSLPLCGPCREAVETKPVEHDRFDFNRERFAELLDLSGIPIKTLAARMGLYDDAGIHRWRTGYYKPQYRHTVENLADQLQCETYELLTDEFRRDECPPLWPVVAAGEFNPYSVRIVLDLAEVRHSRAADVAHVSRTSMGNWLCGRSKPPRREVFQRLADHIGVSIDAFYQAF